MKGFVYLLEVAIVAILVTVVLSMFFSVRIKQNWEKPDLISAGYNILNYIKQDNDVLINILNGNLTDVEALRTKSIKYNLKVIGAPKSNIEVGCAPISNCYYIKNSLLTPTYVNNHWINFTVNELDLDAPEFPDYDAIILYGLGNYSKQKDKINNYLNRGGVLLGINDTSGDKASPGALALSEIFNITDPPSEESTIQLLPNSTNKAYKNTVPTEALCINPSATTAFTDAEYNKTNVSDDNRYSQTSTSTATSWRCTFYKFTFNLTANGITLNSLNSVNMTHEGYYDTMEGYAEFLFYNVTSGAWQSTGLDMSYVDDTTLTKTFTSNFGDIFNTTSGLVQFGILLHAQAGFPIISYTDVAYLDVAYTGGILPITPGGPFSGYETIPKYFLGLGFDVKYQGADNYDDFYMWTRSWKVKRIDATSINITNPSGTEFYAVSECGYFSLKYPLDNLLYKFKVRKIFDRDRLFIQSLNTTFPFIDFSEPSCVIGQHNVINRTDDCALMTSNNTAIWMSDFPNSDEHRTLVKAAILSRANWFVKKQSTTKDTVTVSSFIPMCCDMPETAELYLTLWYEV